MDSTDISIPPGSEPERYSGMGGLEPPTTPMAAPVPAFPAAAQPPQPSAYAQHPEGAGQPAAATPPTNPQVQGGEHCPSCGALLAADQRYCLECGYRRGDPRLPFMDAVVLMDAVKRPAQDAPPPPKKKRSGISPNAALIAGVGTLLLALGIGVLIGRSGSHQTASTAPAAPIVIKGGGGEEVATSTTGASATGAAAGKAKGKGSKKAGAAAKKEASSQKGAEEVLKPAAGVKLPPAEAELGESCEKGTAGCSGSGKFEGNFFGE